MYVGSVVTGRTIEEEPDVEGEPECRVESVAGGGGISDEGGMIEELEDESELQYD